MTQDRLSKYCLDTIMKYPKIEYEIKSYYQLAIDEIEQGGSGVHEFESCYLSIEELIEDI